jgi:hypothetical protein
MSAVGYTGGDPNKVDVAGDTMTGPLVLPGDPASGLQAATKDYVDTHGGGGGGGGTPSTTVVSETSYGQSATAGAATTYSRGDHTHGSPALGATGTTAALGNHLHTGTYDPNGAAASALVSALAADVPLGSATPSAVSIAGSGSAGAGTSSSRQDHAHAGPGFGSVTAQTSFGASSADGVATTVAHSDHTHGTPTAPTVPSASSSVTAETSFGISSAAGVAATFSRGDHTHGSPTAPTAASVGAAATVHTHVESDVTSLVSDLAGKQPLDSDLTTIAGLTATTGNVIQSVGSAWASQTPAQLKTSLSLVKGDVGLGNIDNTSDANKPVSTAQQTALNLKADLASPTFTGTPTLPTGSVGVTQTAGNSTTALATTAFVTTADALKAPLATPTFTGTPAAPTPAANTKTTQLATTAFVMTQARQTLPFAFTGAALITTGVLRWYNRTGRTLTVIGTWAAANTAPTGADIIADVLKNGTTLYTGGTNRPTVPATTNGGVLSAAPAVTNIADGDYLTVNISQIGSTIAGSNVTVGVVVE